MNISKENTYNVCAMNSAGEKFNYGVTSSYYDNDSMAVPECDTVINARRFDTSKIDADELESFEDEMRSFLSAMYRTKGIIDDAYIDLDCEMGTCGWNIVEIEDDEVEVTKQVTILLTIAVTIELPKGDTEAQVAEFLESLDYSVSHSDINVLETDIRDSEISSETDITKNEI